MNFIKLIKPFTFELNSWCFSFRWAYGEENPNNNGPKEKRPGIGFGIDNPPEMDELDEDDD